ncbi:cytochrome P460 family protein [Mucilaginibacter sp. SP1R1]|uniref:cytochrome P460 family protein n=1 Tax=Mucilaginibacter sp. SP1R1 TaxID=2723091 RepID=UPI001608834C|nr:cytochrome P460 family protein [Mucilaginibacter sp. SP1R1]MBB6151378.1 hypothetical protein [Mucilaginibacter sp. SP1R1]
MKMHYILLAAIVLMLSACTEHTPSEDLLNKKAAIPASFNFSKAGLKVITSSFNRKNKTMSTLYGNDLALKTAIACGTSYPAGENLTLVTWKQQEDDRWFGARIPGDLQSIEVVKTAHSNTDNGTTISYQKFEGRQLAINTDTLGQKARIKYIFAQKPSVMP